MTRLLRLALAPCLVLIACTSHPGPQSSSSAATPASVCDLVNRPDSYNGKLVIFSATVEIQIEFTLLNGKRLGNTPLAARAAAS